MGVTASCASDAPRQVQRIARPFDDAEHASDMLRHGCGFKLANDGVDTRALQHYLGHRSITHTGELAKLPFPAHPHSAADHFEEPSPRHWAAAFGVEDEATLQVLPPQLPKGPDLLAGERVRACDAVLSPPHMDTAAIKLDQVPGQFAKLAGARASRVGEMSRPSVVAVLRLITNSNLVGCKSGSSADVPALDIAGLVQALLAA